MAKVEESVVFARIADEFAFKKSDVEDGGVVVDELQQIHFQRQTVLEFRLGSRQFLLGQPQRYPFLLISIGMITNFNRIRNQIIYFRRIG